MLTGGVSLPTWCFLTLSISEVIQKNYTRSASMVQLHTSAPGVARGEETFGTHTDLCSMTAHCWVQLALEVIVKLVELVIWRNNEAAFCESC